MRQLPVRHQRQGLDLSKRLSAWGCGLPAADRADQPLARSGRAHPGLGSVAKAV